MRRFLVNQWFLIALVALISLGCLAGALGQAPALKPLTRFLQPKIFTALILFLMALSLETRQLVGTLQRPLPVIVGFVSGMGLIPLLAWLSLGWQLNPDLRGGVMIAASVPSTLAAASVLTRRAGGNVAVSLLITLSTNLTCFLVTPFWLRLATGTQIGLPTQTLIFDLLITVLVPTLLGQLARLPVPLRTLATTYKLQISIVAQILIVSIVFSAALTAGERLRAGSAALTVLSIMVAWATCLGLHFAAMLCGYATCRGLGVGLAECDAVAFAGSQKTLPIGTYIAQLAGTTHPFALLPMLLFHASQLIVDTIIADQLARRKVVANALPSALEDRPGR